MAITKSTEDFEREIGDQVRRLRISSEMDQTQLASAANVSVGAIKNIEGGKGSSLKTMIRIVRALGYDAWLGSLSPESAVSPMQVLINQSLHAPRRRVFRKRADRV